MKSKKLGKINRRVAISLLICTMIIGMLAPAAFAASAPACYARITVSRINVRSGPGLDYEVVYEVHSGDLVGLDGNTFSADGYTWYYLADASGNCIAATGGWELVSSGAFDYLTCYDGYGQLVFDHECSGDGSVDWGYWIDVDVRSYLIRCSCGWSYSRLAEEKVMYNSDGEWAQTIYFLGLDTDNDERVDLYPGQSKFLPNRAGSDLRKYTLLEFYDVERPTPTVTLVFGDGDDNELARYVFDWSVDVFVEPYGIRMVGMDGTERIYYVDYEFLCRDVSTDVFLGDVGIRYKVDQSIKDMAGLPFFVHMEFDLVISRPGSGGLGPLEWLTHIVRSISDTVVELFKNFFGLAFIFTDENSPFRFLIGG